MSNSSSLIQFLCLGLLTGAAACTSGDDSFQPGMAEFEILSHQLDGNLLRLDVQYGGGCEEHEFLFCWSGIAAASDPPQIPIEINHYAYDDSCKALISRSIYVDISTIADISAGGSSSVSLLQPLGEGAVRGKYGFDYIWSSVPVSTAPEPIHAVDRTCGTLP